MTDEHIFNLADACALYKQGGTWEFSEKDLLDFVQRIIEEHHPSQVTHTDFKSVCKELVDDLDLWMEYDGQPSRLPTEYRNSLELIYKVRRILKETK